MKQSVVILSFVLCLNASAKEFSFERISTADGLSQNNVLAICQDSDGYLWFGTYDGINRFDGYDFKTYRTKGDTSSLSSNLIRYLTEDQNKNIWVGTFNSGVCKFNRVTHEFTQFLNTKEIPNLITSNTIRNIFCDSKSRVWISTSDGVTVLLPDDYGSYKIKKLVRNTDKPESLYWNDVQSVLEDQKGRIWISNFHSLDLMIMDDNGEIDNNFHHLIFDKQFRNFHNMIELAGGYAFSHHRGISFFKLLEKKPEDSESIHFDIPQSFHLGVDPDTNLWAGGHNGVFRFEYRGGDTVPFVLTNSFKVGDDVYSLSDQFIRALFIDNAGILWLGTNGKGILKYNTQKNKFRHYKKTKIKGSISHNKVFCIYEDKEHNVWIGTEGGGLNILPKGNGRNYKNGFVSFRVNPVGQQNFVMDVLEVNHNNATEIWSGVGYDSKIIKVDNRNGRWKPEKLFPEIAHQIMTICQDSYNNIWIGSYEGGLFKYTQGNGQGKLISYSTRNSNLPSEIIRNIVEDSKGRLWIGTDKGLILLTPEQKNSDSLEFTFFQQDINDTTSISFNYVVPILETKKGEIWIGTFGQGINIYKEGTELTNGTFTDFFGNDELPNTTIKSIIEDDLGDIWITTNKGLTRISTEDNKIRTFTTKDGLQDMEYIDLSGCKLHDGEILFGGVNGFNAFYPDEIFKNKVPPQVVFNDLEVMGVKVAIKEYYAGNQILQKAFNETDEIVLKHTQNSFRIFFSAIQFDAPLGNKFKYMLEGFDKEWKNSSAEFRFCTYTNINAGKYIFKVHAANSDGVWTKEPKELLIWIKPPFWLTAWFKIVVFLLIILIIATIVFIRFYLIRQKNIQLEDEVEKRIKEIRKMNRVLYKQAKSLNETNTQLEERQQLIEEQAEELLSQKEALEITNATKDKFYSILAHDLKGPFNSLMGYLELLYLKFNKYDSTKGKEKIKYALDSSQTLYRLVQNLLQWSRSQRGLIPFNPVESRFIDVVMQVATIYNNMAEEKGIKIIYENIEDDLSVFIDPDMFKTILRNLLSNAIKYTETGGKVDVSASNYLLDNKKFILIKVSDTGLGIPSSKVEQLFQIDSNYSTQGTNKEQGTGLGLVLCKEFVLHHKGKIWVESIEGKGTDVFFTIPVKE